MAGRRRKASLTTVTANVNGIRAAARRGGLDWLGEVEADVICLQEVRATHEQVHEQLSASPLSHLHVSHSPAATLGRNGVAVLTREPPRAVRIGIGPDEFAHQGRWIEVDIATPFGPTTVVSAYVHTGEAGTPRQEEKFRFLDAMDRRLATLRRRASRSQGHVLVTGDFNIAQSEMDIKNWRPNRDKAGFLPEERAYLDRWFGTLGGNPGPWHDLGRRLGGPGPGPYTWWSWRGRGFDTDGGWRIDYQVVTPGLAVHAREAIVGKAPTYAERWSDHAPLTVRYE
ncbi:MAG: exodeoxyribonuclease III [Candidatus Nanopelagicales bacterium]|nr:exodeoxyribonuclease III [Candidatus Nanopelagicales bacterium]